MWLEIVKMLNEESNKSYQLGYKHGQKRFQIGYAIFSFILGTFTGVILVFIFT